MFVKGPGLAEEQKDRGVKIFFWMLDKIFGYILKYFAGGDKICYLSVLCVEER